MKPRILERNWREAAGHVAHAWIKNPWIISRRMGSQEQQTRDVGWGNAAVETPGVPSEPTACTGSTRRQQAAESNWENEGGATKLPVQAPGHSTVDD